MIYRCALNLGQPVCPVGSLFYFLDFNEYLFYGQQPGDIWSLMFTADNVLEMSTGDLD